MTNEQRKTRALNALLDSNTLTEAAEKAEISRRTLEKGDSMKDGWHVVRGLEVYIENGLVIRGIKTDSNGGRVTAYLYRKARGGGWNKDEGMTVAALKAGLIRGSIALK